jgi:hypothetical protein
MPCSSLKSCLISASIRLSSAVTAVAGRQLRGFTPLKVPDPRVTVLTSTVCSPHRHTVQAHMNFYGTNLFSSKQFSHHSLLHACICNICHFDLRVRCAHVTDPSATHSRGTGDFSCYIGDARGFVGGLGWSYYFRPTHRIYSMPWLLLR